MEEDIKILEKKLKQWEPYKNIKFPTPIEREISKENRAIENLINKYKEQEKMIELMGDCIRCADLDEDIPCEHKFNCTECMIDYFRKKAKGE